MTTLAPPTSRTAVRAADLVVHGSGGTAVRVTDGVGIALGYGGPTEVAGPSVPGRARVQAAPATGPRR